MKELFHHGQRNTSSSNASSSNTNSSDTSSSNNDGSVLARADKLCKQLRLKRSANRRSSIYKSSKRVCAAKEVQKGLVVIDFQGYSPPQVVSLKEYQKIYDGCIRYMSNMSEDEIRNEIVRLVRQKESITHDFSSITPTDFDFVRCVNRQVRAIDGDVPFDSDGISQVYKNGAIYARMNSDVLSPLDVRKFSCL